MVDNLSQAERSLVMAKVRSKNTKPEQLLRKALFNKGLRYRLHARDLPGSPDLVFRGGKAVFFIHGCLWHWHGCRRSRMPATNIQYWQAKIGRNQARDAANIQKLLDEGWRVLVIWECQITRRNLDELVAKSIHWLTVGDSRYATIPNEPNQRQQNSELASSSCNCGD